MNEIAIDYERTRKNRLNDPEIVLNLEDLQNIATKQQMEGSSLVIRFTRDRYEGEVFDGVYLRGKADGND